MIMGFKSFVQRKWFSVQKVVPEIAVAPVEEQWYLWDNPEEDICPLYIELGLLEFILTFQADESSSSAYII